MHDIVQLHGSPRILALLIVFIVVVVLFLLNLLIAQLVGAYRKVYGDMEGFARLFRSSITVSTVRNLRPKRWAAFLKGLNFQERIEFNEGDIGIAGGIQ
ncbi:ANK1, partial [Symbiodinium sp. CCMP2456]